MIKALVFCLNILSTVLLSAAYDHVGLARMRVCTLLCIHAHTNPDVKHVLETSIMAMIVTSLLIPDNIKNNPCHPVIRPYVNGDVNIRPDSSRKTIHSSLSTTHDLTPMFLIVSLKKS